MPVFGSPERPLRILQVTPQYAPSVGGVQSHVREVSIRLRAEGFQVEVLTADQNWALPSVELIDGVTVRRVRAVPKGGDQLLAPTVLRHVSTGGWDLVHVQCYHTFVAPLAMAAAARSRIPYVLTFHGGGHTLRHRNALRRYQLRGIRPLLARAGALIATADWEIERYSTLLGLPPERFVLIPNGGDLPSPAVAVDIAGTLIVSIGRLERFKGHHHAIAALPHVLREIPDARLWVAGHGPYEGELVALAQRLGVSDRVEISVVRDRGAYGARLASASLATLLSEFETHPMAATEAIALGVPTLVGHDNGGLTELADKGLVRSVSLEAGPPQHAAAMVRSIREPLPRPEIEVISWAQSVDALRSLYLRLLHQRDDRPPQPGANMNRRSSLIDRAGGATAPAFPDAADVCRAAPRAADHPARAWTTVLSGTLGLALIAGAFALERLGRGDGWAGTLFWVGLTIVILPILWFLIARNTRRSDRLLLVAFAALLTYAVKVLHDPLMFTFGDEFGHLAETQRMLESQQLFEHIPLSGISVAAGYPGMHAIAVAISEVGGVPLFASGLVVVGTARLVLMLGLFLLIERVSGSARIAGVGALAYAGSANFLFWSAQFSYQSLSLPLFVVAILTIVQRSHEERGSRHAFTACAALLTIAIVATHHVTSYALVVSLWFLTILSFKARWRAWRAVDLALFATACTVTWFLVAARGTASYLSYVFGRTADAVVEAGHRGTRVPFQSSSGLTTPLAERLIGMLAAAAVVIGVLWALRRLCRHRRTLSAPGVLLALAGAGFVALFPFKVFPGAWETANRSADFLFVGVAWLLSGLGIELEARAKRPRLARAAIAGALLLVVAGGVIQGWPSALRLSQPLEVKHGAAVIRPQGLAVTRWAVTHLPSSSVYVADESTGRELAVGGARFVLGGGAGGVPQLLRDPTLPPWQRQVLTGNRVDFVVVDRRRISGDNLAGYAFQSNANPGGGFGYSPLAVRRKFERIPRSRRVWDSGDIVVYDVRGLRSPPPRCARVTLRFPAEALTCATPRDIITIAGADRVARLPGERVQILETSLRPHPDGVDVSVRVLLTNTGAHPYAPDPDGQHLYLSARRQFIRERSVPFRHDTFAGALSLRPGAQRQGSLTFALRGAAAQHFRKLGGELRIRVPRAAGVPGPERIGVIPVSARGAGGSR